MTKTEATERPEKAGKMTALRLDTKTRYLADLAARITGDSLTSYIEKALTESFRNVTLRARPEPELIYGTDGKVTLAQQPDAEEERIKDEAMSIANQADLIWSESEYLRMLMLSILNKDLLFDEDKALLKYVNDRKDLWKTGTEHKPNREKIDAEWEAIKTDFEKSKKGKAKQ